MKKHLIIIILSLFPVLSYGQAQETNKGFGFAINSSVNGEIDPIRIVSSMIYFKGNNQFELGIGFNPSDRQSQKLLSGEINYKYFPNGNGKKYNMYLITRLIYANSANKTFYPTTYNYLFVNGGYGFNIIPFKNAFMGTNVSLGAFTSNKKSEIPYKAFKSQKFFEEIGMSIAFQANIGYRF